MTIISDFKIEQLRKKIEAEIYCADIETKKALQRILDNVNIILSPSIYIVKMGDDGYMDITKEKTMKNDSLGSATIFDSEAEAYLWIERAKHKKITANFNVIPIPKENAKVGDVLDGYCDGFFDGEWDKKTITAVSGYVITVENEKGETFTEDFHSWQNSLPIMLAQWKRDFE